LDTLGHRRSGASESGLMRACFLLLASVLAAQTIVDSPARPLKTLVDARDAIRANGVAEILDRSPSASAMASTIFRTLWCQPRRIRVSALNWCDGKRNLGEEIRPTTLEVGAQNFDFVGYFKFLEKHGCVEFVQPTR
jgi:hypothetical protein